MDCITATPSVSGAYNNPLIPDIPKIVEVFQLTIPPGSDVKKQCSSCFKAIILACQNQQWSKIEQVREGIWGLRDKKGRSLFSALLAQSNPEIIQGVIDHKFHRALASDDFRGDLHDAVRNGNMELFKLLWTISGINTEDSEGKTPLHVAIETGQEEMVEALMKNGASVEKGYAYKNMVFSSWAYAIKCGQIECFDILATGKVDLWVQSMKGVGNLLHVAIQFGQIDCLRHLLTKYHKETVTLLNQKKKGYTALLLATYLGDVESLALLEERGASLSSTDAKGRTALHLAALHGHRRVIPLLYTLKKELLNLIDLDGKVAADLAEDQTLKDYIHNIQKQSRGLMPHIPQNLLFSGGCIQDYNGALEALPIKEVRRVGGTQGGAIVATLLAFGEDVSELTKEALEAKIFEKTQLPHCTFGELHELIARGHPFKNLHLFSDKFHFSSEDPEWKDLIISDTVFLGTCLYFKNQGKRRADDRVVASIKHCPTDAFDCKRYMENGLTEEEGAYPIYNHRTLTLAIGLEEGARVIPLKRGELGKQAIKRYFKQIAATDETLFYRPAARSLISTIDLKAPLSSFVGREKEMTQLEKALLSNTWKTTDPFRSFAICGPGGQGKSELACTFANRHIGEFSLIHWINCETEEARTNSYRDLAKALKIYIDEKANPEEIRKALFLKLENHRYEKPWLLIFDNVEEAVPYPQRGGSILSTSRSQNCLPFQHSLLAPLTEAESITLLEKLTGQKDEGSMQLLINELGSSPLILNNAASYMIEQGITLNEYLKDLEDDRSIIFYGPETERYPRSIKNAWALTFDALKKTHSNAFAWLNLCAYLNPIKIPKVWIQNWLKEKGLKGIGLRQEIRSLITELHNYGLVDFDDDTISLHHLIQEMVQSFEEHPFVAYKNAVDLAQKEGVLVDKDLVATWPLAKLWISQATWLANNLLFSQLNVETQGKMWHRLGICKKISTDYQGALQAYEKALEVFQSFAKGKPSSEVATLLNDIGDVWQALGKDKKALEFYQEALKALDEQNLLGRASALNNIGRALQNLGYQQQALTHYEDSFKIRKEVYNDAPHRDKADSLNNIGSAWQSFGEHQQALKYYRDSLAMRIEVYNDTPHPDPDIAMSYNNIGNALHHLNRLQEALQWYQDSLEMKKMIYKDAPHPDIAMSYNNIGTVFQDLGQSKQALEYYKKSLKIKRKIYGQGPHPDTAISYYNIGSILQDLRLYRESLKYYNECLQMRKEIYEDPHSDTVNVLVSLGIAHQKLNDFSESLKHFLEALTLNAQLGNEREHPTTQLILSNSKGVVINCRDSADHSNYLRETIELHRKLGYENEDPKTEFESNLINLSDIKLPPPPSTQEILARAILTMGAIALTYFAYNRLLKF